MQKSGIMERRGAIEAKRLFRSLCPSHNGPVTDLLDRAVATARDLSPEMQDDIARVMLTLAGDDASIYQLTPEEEADLAEPDAEVARGDFATDEEVRALWAKHGL